MFGNLFDKAYESGGDATLAINPQILMIILMVISLIYIFYSIASMTMEINSRFYYEKYIFPIMNFYLMGCCIGQSGYGCIFGVVDGTNDGSDKIKYTLSNIKDWHFAKYTLIAGGVCILFIFIIQILMAKNPGHFIRDVLFMICISVFGFCVARFAMTVDGFLLKLLFLPTSALAFICQFMWPFGLLLWLLPTSVIAAMNKANEEKEKNTVFFGDSSSQDESEDTDVCITPKFPTSLTDGQGETWMLLNTNIDHAEYKCRKNGAQITLWYTDYLHLPNGWRIN